MNQRIAKITQNVDMRGLWSGTFHSLFSRLLRRHAETLGFTPAFTIYDTTDTKSLLKTIITEKGYDDKTYKPAIIASKISNAKNRVIMPEFYASQSDLIKHDRMDNVGDTYKIYAEYVRRCKQANAMDFDDLLLNTYLLLSNNAAICESYKERFRYILVDEYQDTNHLQHRIVCLLTNPDSRLCVVGDDAQSIYGFRGANIDNILQFQKTYPAARMVKLECNYRSTQNIVNAANCVIGYNRNQIKKTVFSKGKEGDKLQFSYLHSDREEAERIAMEIRRLRSKHNISPEEIAVLYRTNAQSRVIEEALRNANIAYRIYGGLSFYGRKEIKDCIAYLRLICNPNDEEAFKRIINYPARGIGATTIKKIQSAAVVAGVSLWEVIKHPSDFPECNVNKGTLAKLQGFQQLIEAFQTENEGTSAFELASKVITASGIAQDLAADKTAEGISRRENVEELLNSIKEFETERLEEFGEKIVPIGDFLSQVSLLTDADQKDDDTPKVSLMTIHAAKGLEFEVVFVSGLEDNLFPNANARYNPREMEEERRLFYVAITRAKHYLCLSASMSRFKYGQMEFSEISPFVKEISKEYLDDSRGRVSSFSDTRSTASAGTFSQSAPHSAAPASSLFSRTSAFTSSSRPSPTFSTTAKPSVAPSSAASTSDSTGFSTNQQLCVGDIVCHERFGMGEVLELEYKDSDARALVSFEASGVKKLLLKFARLKIVRKA